MAVAYGNNNIDIEYPGGVGGINIGMLVSEHVLEIGDVSHG